MVLVERAQVRRDVGLLAITSADRLNAGWQAAERARIIRVALSETYDSKATDLSALVAKMKATPGIQAVVNWSVAPAQAIIAKNMRQANWRVPLFQSHGFGNIRYAEAAGAAWDAHSDAQIVERFGADLDHPVTLSFPEGDYLKGLLLRKF